MKAEFTSAYQVYKTELIDHIHHFKTRGELFGNGDRNVIRLIKCHGQTLNFKSFKIPNLINQFAYRYVRESKAKRSFIYANQLKSKGIGTPEPVGFVEFYSWFGLKQSFYISHHDVPNYTFRDLVTQAEVETKTIANYDTILRAFTRFSLELHNKQVEFLDHSPGNTLIYVEANGELTFKLVDLNRMRFRSLDFDARMKNLSRLTPHQSMVKVIANEYAKHYQASESEIFEKLWFYTHEFQRKFHKKQALKRKIKGR